MEILERTLSEEVIDIISKSSVRIGDQRATPRHDPATDIACLPLTAAIV